MSNDKKLLIVGNSESIHTNNLKTLVGSYFNETKILNNQDFSIQSPLKLLKAIMGVRKLLKSFLPSFIILYQIDIAAFFLSLINHKIPSLVVGIGSDVLTVANKSQFHKFMASYVINHGKYFNAGSIAIKEKMQQLSKNPIKVIIANLGADDILPKDKQNIIFSNRLHKKLYNIDKIINAFERFIRKKEHKTWKLIIASTGMQKELIKQVKELGIEQNVEFVGWLNREQNAHYYSISKIWVSLPKSDSISISLLEAMSGGCIPVCYDVSALNGFLTNNKNAVVVKDFEENFFERALLLDNPEVIANNRKQARKFADKDLNRQRFYSIFEKEFGNN